MITLKDNIKEPLARLYFCKYCLELRAEQSDQIQTEVDSHFSMHALGSYDTNRPNPANRNIPDF